MSRVSKIMGHYSKEAKLHGLSGTCTIQDIRTRYLELNAISKFIQDGMRVGEVGCGNGFTAKELAKRFYVTIEASDLNRDLVNLAKKHPLKNSKGKVAFSIKNVLSFRDKDKFNLIFTERCLQNLLSWNQQKRALELLRNALTLGGTLILVESFFDCLKNLNEARKELNLSPIHPPWYNHWFDKNKLVRHAARMGLQFFEEDNFLSGYYFGSRVILPAIYPKDKKVQSNSRLNDFFAGLPSSGAFGPMKLMAFKKVRKK